MKKKEIINFIFMVFIPLIVNSIISFTIKNDFQYIETLNRKIIIPPIVFIIVWSILYILMGLWAYFYEKDYQNDKTTLAIYWFSLIVNMLFAPILFLGHLLYLALFDVIALLIMIMYLFIKTIIKNKKYAYLLFPYCIWLIMALTLMIDLIMHN